MDVGKRNHSRLRTRLRARLVTRTSEDRAVLANLSQDGCCLELMHIPSEDVVLVQWSRFEVFGSIVWRELGRLGVRFDETIPYDWVLETRELDSSSAPISEVQDARETAKAWAEGKRIV